MHVPWKMLLCSRWKGAQTIRKWLSLIFTNITLTINLTIAYSLNLKNTIIALKLLMKKSSSSCRLNSPRSRMILRNCREKVKRPKLFLRASNLILRMKSKSWKDELSYLKKRRATIGYLPYLRSNNLWKREWKLTRPIHRLIIRMSRVDSNCL